MRNLVKLGMLAGLVAGGVLAQLPGVLAADYTIVLDKMRFGAVPAELHVGDTITWQNDDLFVHTATARDGSFDLALPVKGAASVALDKAGSVDFFCKFHPGMTGTLLVLP